MSYGPPTSAEAKIAMVGRWKVNLLNPISRDIFLWLSLHFTPYDFLLTVGGTWKVFI